MTNEEKKPEEEKKAENEEKKPEEEKKMDDHKEEEKEKATSVIDALKSITSAIEKIDAKVSKFDGRIKAMEEPTDLPLKPKLTDSEDIGDKTKVPDTYQSNSQQAGIDDSDPKNENEVDEKKLEMQEKRNVNKSEVVKASPERTFTTETPRPSVRIEQIVKSAEPNPILADARAVGHEGLSEIARNIMKGKYYVPNPNEVALW